MTDMAQALLRAVDRAVAPLKRQIRLTVGRGILTLINDTTLLQEVQVKLLKMPNPNGGVDDELADGTEVMRQYGFTSHPHPGAECVYLSVGGIRSHGIVVAIDDRRYRLKATKEGEVALYDDLGQVVHLRRDGIRLHSPLSVSWDVNGFGESWTWMGGTTWEHKTWQQGATVIPVVLPINPPEGP
jgi:phage baseplate assembly protein V